MKRMHREKSPETASNLKSGRGLIRCVAGFAMCAAVVGHAHAQGIPVIDVDSLAQAVIEVQNLEQQLTTMENQYQTMTTQLTALTGNRGLGQILNNPALHNFMPGSWATIYGDVKSGNLSALGSAAQQIENAEGMTANTPGQQRYNDTLAANKAMSSAGYAQIQSELNNIQALMQQSDATQDPAAKADLQNRIGLENTMVANQRSQMQLMGNLQGIETTLADHQAQQELHNQMAQ